MLLREQRMAATPQQSSLHMCSGLRNAVSKDSNMDSVLWGLNFRYSYIDDTEEEYLQHKRLLFE